LVIAKLRHASGTAALHRPGAITSSGMSNTRGVTTPECGSRGRRERKSAIVPTYQHVTDEESAARIRASS
jgi:hypothetical protein